MLHSFEIYVCTFSREETQVQFWFHNVLLLHLGLITFFWRLMFSKTSKLSFDGNFANFYSEKVTYNKGLCRYFFKAIYLIKAILFIDSIMIETLGCIRNFQFTQL